MTVTAGAPWARHCLQSAVKPLSDVWGANQPSAQ